MVLGLETLLLGALKVTIAKGAVAGAAHATPLVLQHAAMHAAINVTGSVMAAGSISGGALMAVKAGKDTYDFTAKVEEYRQKHNIDVNGKKMPTHLAAQSGSQSNLLEDIYAVALAQIAALQAALMEDGWDFNSQYARLGHEYKPQTKKTHTLQIDACRECPCDDFMLLPGSDHDCQCSHSRSWHTAPTNPYFYLVALRLASHIYEELRHYDSCGHRKVSLDEMRPCTNAPDGCPCADFDRYDDGVNNKRCMCGHDNNMHTAVKGSYSHLYVGLVAEFLYAKIGNINPAKYPKTSLFMIHECSRCDCKDFNFWYFNRLTDNRVCKCDHGRLSHSYILQN